MNKKDKTIRVRMAPSPTGMLHFGTARSALFNYLFAKKNNGIFVLRIEDTDKERSKKEYEEDIVKGFEWLGLNWDEFYRQSERTKIYEENIKKLLDEGKAFWCNHSKEDLEKEKKDQMANKEAPCHICDHWQDKDIQKEKKGIIRLKNNESGNITFNDIVKGKITVDAKLLGDISIAKAEDEPLYNLAVVVDDYSMNITHVIRGEDHISNTPKQILIYTALGFDIPQFAHIPMILNEDRSKMSKRKNQVSLSWYKEVGYLPQAMVNFMSLLGWNPGSEKEIFSLKELTEEFSLERVHKGGAVFDIKKLDWMNGNYIRQMDIKELTERCIPYLIEAGLIESGVSKFKIPQTGDVIDLKYLEKIIKLEQERLKKFSEIGESVDFFFYKKLEYDKNLLIWKKLKIDDIKERLKLVKEALLTVDSYTVGNLQIGLKKLTDKYGNGEILWPLRVALSGKKASPGPYEIMEVLNKDKTLERIESAIELL